jgi:hypothetical protein
MAQAGEVSVKLTMTEQELAQAIDRALAKLKLFEKQTGQNESAFAALGKGISKAGEHVDRFAKNVSVAVAALALFAVKANKISDEVDETSQALGISTRKLQEYQAAVAVAGGSSEQLTQVMVRFSREVGDASTNVTPFRAALGQLGLSIEQIRAMKLDEAFDLVRDRLSRLDSTTKQYNIANELFGRTAGKTANFLRMSADETAKFRKEAQALGLVLSDETIKKGGEAADRTALLGKQMAVTGQLIAAELLPIIRRMNEYLGSKEGQTQIAALTGKFRDLVQFMIDNKEVILLVTGAVGGALLGGRVGPAGALVGAIAGTLLMAKQLHDVKDAAKEATKWTVELGNAGEKAGTQITVGLGGKGGAIPIFPQITDAIKELEVKRKLMLGQLGGMAEEFPSALKGLNIPGVDAIDIAAAGVDKLTGSFKKYNDQLVANQIVDIRKSLLTESEAMQEEYEKRLALVATFEQSRIAQEAKFAGLRTKLQQKQALDMAMLQARQYSMLAQVVDTSMGQISQIIGREGGAAFNIIKAISMATALVKGYEAAVNAYAYGSAVGGPVLGAAFAAIAAAGVAAQIAAIARTTPESANTGAASASSFAAGGGDTAGAAGAAGGGGGNQTLYINGLNRTDLYSGDAVRDLSRAIIQFQRDGGKVMLNG